MITRYAINASTLLLAVALSGCSPGPAAEYELAAQGIYTGAISRGAEYALVGSLNHGGSLWRGSDHERLYNWNHRQGEFSELVATAFSTDGSRAVTTDPRTLVFWNTITGEAISYWTTPAPVLDVAIVAGSSRVLMGLEDHSAVLFDAESGDHVETLLHEGMVRSVDVTADGRLAVTGSEDETAAVWQLDSGERIQTFDGSNPIRVVAISPAGRLVFTASQGREVAIWDTATGNRLHLLSDRNQGITSAAFAEDEQTILIGYVNRTVELWDVQRGQRLDQWYADAKNPLHPTGSAILAVAYAQQAGYYWALSGDGRLVQLRSS